MLSIWALCLPLLGFVAVQAATDPSSGSLELFADAVMAENATVQTRQDFPSDGASEKINHTFLVPREDEKFSTLYIALATDPENLNETQQTRKCLEGKVRENTKFYDMSSRGQVFGWGMLSLNETALKEVEAYEGISHVGVDGPRYRAHAAEAQTTSPSATSATDAWDVVNEVAQQGAKLVRRTVTWVAQKKAPWELVSISHYRTNRPVTDFEDYVHAKDAGKDVFIYVTEERVQTDIRYVSLVPRVIEEVSNWKRQHLQPHTQLNGYSVL